MPKSRLLQTVCAVVMLAAVPAFAQTNSEPADTGAGGKLNNPTGGPNSDNMAPPDKMGSGSGSMGGSHAMGRHGRHAMHTGHMHGGSSMDMSADKLNEQSYQAARNGQPYMGSGQGGMSGGSGGMNDMSGGSMSNGMSKGSMSNGMSGGSMSNGMSNDSMPGGMSNGGMPSPSAGDSMSTGSSGGGAK